MAKRNVYADPQMGDRIRYTGHEGVRRCIHVAHVHAKEVWYDITSRNPHGVGWVVVGSFRVSREQFAAGELDRRGASDVRVYRAKVPA